MLKQKRLLFGPIAGFVLAVMLAGSILAPASFAAAEKENDNDKDDKNNKCSQHKYDGKCDNQKPHVNIMWPVHNNDKLPGPTVIVAGIAYDTGSGIKDVKISIDGGAWTSIAQTNGPWFVTESLSTGTHHAKVRAFDNANNEQTDSIAFKIT